MPGTGILVLPPISISSCGQAWRTPRRFSKGPHHFDIGIDFEAAWANRAAAHLGGYPVNFIGREDLIRNKESTGRAKDLGDADELRKRDPSR